MTLFPDWKCLIICASLLSTVHAVPLHFRRAARLPCDAVVADLQWRKSSGKASQGHYRLSPRSPAG
jgi:hypothetical protein